MEFVCFSWKLDFPLLCELGTDNIRMLFDSLYFLEIACFTSFSLFIELSSGDGSGLLVYDKWMLFI